MIVSKIISGGQTGVDQAALRVCQELKFDCGGWCPPGRVCEIGVIPENFPLQETHDDRSPETPTVPRSQRTRWNVRDSDATLIIAPKKINHSNTNWAMECAKNYARPVFVSDPEDQTASMKIREWLENLSIHTLNVAGPSESVSPGIGEKAYGILHKTFSLS
jgi:hypothetical protein